MIWRDIAGWQMSAHMIPSVIVWWIWPTGEHRFFHAYLVADNSWWIDKCNEYLVGGWTNPFEKYARQNGFIFPNFRGEHSKNIWVATTQILFWQHCLSWEELASIFFTPLSDASQEPVTKPNGDSVSFYENPFVNGLMIIMMMIGTNSKIICRSLGKAVM